MTRVVVDASAKVNIGWQVGPVRDDGFHDVQGLIQTITLRDRITVTSNQGANRLVTVVVPGFPELDEGNLVERALECLTVVKGHEPTPVRIEIEKHIPIAAGLGGGSADAAAALLALTLVWKVKKSTGDLVRMSGAIGSDVPAILRGGLVHVTGRGERVRSLGSFTQGVLVLGVTRDGISAGAAYAALDRLGPLGGARAFHANDLEAAACDLQPGLAERLAAMRDAAGIAFVSGSGPTVVGVVPTRTAAASVRERVASVFDDVLIAEPSGWGVRARLGS